MDTLAEHIQEYRHQLSKGIIQTAYKGIMAFMSDLKSFLENDHPDCFTSALYYGYMDMTYFAFTPPVLRQKRLKIAIVYLHEQGHFEVWLGGSNRKIQAEYIDQLSCRNPGRYQLSQVHPGVDSIIESMIVDQPDFDKLEALKVLIEKKTIEFTQDMIALLAQ